MSVISLLYYCFKGNNEEINIFAIFDWQNLKEDFKCFGEKIETKIGKKGLEEKFEVL